MLARAVLPLLFATNFAAGAWLQPHNASERGLNSSAEDPTVALARMTEAERKAIAKDALPNFIKKAKLRYPDPDGPEKAYAGMDHNRDGLVAASEWMDECTLLPIDPVEAWMAFQSLDHDHSKRLDKHDEFYKGVGKLGDMLEWAEDGKVGPGAQRPEAFSPQGAPNAEEAMDPFYHDKDYMHDDQPKVKKAVLAETTSKQDPCAGCSDTALTSHQKCAVSMSHNPCSTQYTGVAFDNSCCIAKEKHGRCLGCKSSGDRPHYGSRWTDQKASGVTVEDR